MAIHGGGLEQMTDVIAERAADAAGASVYVVRHPAHYPHHLSSARYLAAESDRLAEFLDHVDVAVSLHGYGRIGRSTQVLAGGGNRTLAAHLARHVDRARLSGGHRSRRDPRELRGLHPDNPVNRVRDGGAQLELTPRVRGISPRSPMAGDDGLSPRDLRAGRRAGGGRDVVAADLSYSSMSSTGVGRWKPRVTNSNHAKPIASQINPTSSVSHDRLIHNQTVSRKPITGRIRLLSTFFSPSSMK